MKSAAFFNHKGGVGKTTLTYHLAYALADMGKKIFIVDADAQCNLTAIVFTEEQYEEIYGVHGYTIAKALTPRIMGTGDIDVQEPVEIVTDRLWMLPGDVQLPRFESLLPSYWYECFAGEERGLRGFSAIFRLVNKIAQSKKIDYIFYDLGPNIGELNKSVLLGVDGFILPVTPDIFSFRAISVVGEIIINWINDWNTIKRQQSEKISFDFQKGQPRFLGFVSQQFGIYRTNPTQAFQYWMERMEPEIETRIVGQFNNFGAPLNNIPQPFALQSIKNYHSLIPESQKHRLPIFKLKGNIHINPGHMGSVNECGVQFRQLATEFIQRIG